MDDYPVQMTIQTQSGEGILEKIYFTELGHLMAKVYIPETKSWSRINIGSVNSLLEERGMSIKEFTTYKPVAFNKLTKI